MGVSKNLHNGTQRAPLSVLAPSFAPVLVESRHSPQLQTPRPVTPSQNAAELAFGRLAGDAGDAGDADDRGEPASPPALLDQVTRALRNCMGSWLVSLAMHMLLLMLLTLVTFGVTSGDIGLELAFSDSVSPVETLAIDFELSSDASESEELQDLESLQAAEVEQAESPVVEVDDGLFGEPVSLDFSETSLPVGETGLGNQPAAAVSGRGESASQMTAGSGTRFYGIESNGSRFVFVIDCSGSMATEYRWDRAVAELLSAVRMLESDQKFLVMTYNYGGHVMMGLSFEDARLVRATSRNKQQLKRWLTSQRPNGVTMPASAMMVGLSLNVDAIFLLSDGILMDNTEDMLRVRNQPRRLRGGGGKITPVHTVAMDMGSEGEVLMRRIAAQNEGVFRLVE